jgi:integrase
MPALERKLEAALEKVRASVATEEAKELILEFLSDLKLGGNTGKSRITVLAGHLRYWAEALGERFPNPTKADVKQAVAAMMDGKVVKHVFRIGHVPTKKGFALTTLRGKKASLKQFYKWHLGNGEEYPECVRWIKLEKIDPSDTVPEDHLTPVEVEAIIHEANSLRDKALISLLYDMGSRIGEMLALRIKHAVFDEEGAFVNIPNVEGYTKTGARKHIRLFGSLPRLQTWLNEHPQKGDKEAFLFPAKKLPAPTETGQKRGTWTGEYGVMIYQSAWGAIKRAAKNAGISKRVYPHLFRHSRSTDLAAKDMGQAALESRMGWRHGSKMAQTYINLTGKQQDEAFRKAEGLPIESRIGNRAQKCVRCQQQNPGSATFCQYCGMGLTEEAVASRDTALAVRETDINELVQQAVETAFAARTEEKERRDSIILRTITQTDEPKKIKALADLLQSEGDYHKDHMKRDAQDLASGEEPYSETAISVIWAEDPEAILDVDRNDPTIKLFDKSISFDEVLDWWEKSEGSTLKLVYTGNRQGFIDFTKELDKAFADIPGMRIAKKLPGETDE